MLSGEVSAALVNYCHTALALRAIAAAVGGFESFTLPKGVTAKYIKLYIKLV
jgi:hypothetical protein